MENEISSTNQKMILESPNLTCECGCKIFDQKMVIKRISALLSPSGKEEFLPIDVVVCSKCGALLKQLYPDADVIFGTEPKNKLINN
jgi:hypothetical protein